MKKIVLFLSLLLAQALGMQAQQRTCASHDVHLNMLQTDAQYAVNRDVIEKQTARFVSEGKTLRALKTIPVVFHVVYRTATENISDAQIMSQLTILNNDFRKLNTDWLNTPVPFQGLAADCEIQFCLAQQDPNGNPTTGIKRVLTSVTSFSSNNAMKYTAQGGSDIWDRNRYLNIWVCNLGGGLLGYAQFPGGAAATDGVVINHNATGNVGTAAFPYNKGRTATHEVGHWLNLYHIWGDDGTGCNGSDQVNDTPNQGGSNYGCPTFPKVSCANGVNGDLFMNYMDYTDDACMYMFTTGQKTRMDALFAAGGSRASLLTSNGCTPPTPVLCGVPGTPTASSITTNSAVINWTAVAGALSYTFQYKLSADIAWQSINTANTTYTLSGLNTSTSYQCRVLATCTAGSGAWSSTTTFTTLSPAPACTNTYEPNNTRNTAITLLANNTYSSMINTSTDKDYFRFTTTTAAPKVQITLNNLPADYDMRMYSSNGATQIGISQLSGTTSEVIKYNAATKGSTYFVYIYGYNGAFNANACYSLNISTSATPFRESAPAEFINKPELDIYPNPANDVMMIRYFADPNQPVIARVYNSMGQTVYTTQEQSMQEGENLVKIPVQQLANGLYLVEMIFDGERKATKIQVNH
jgi:hypothetical protein